MADKDTDKITKPITLADLLKKAKTSPWVLTVIALGGGTGAQEFFANIGQKVEWWWVALAVTGYGALTYLSDNAKRHDKLMGKLSDIEGTLKVGEQIHKELKVDVAEVKSDVDSLKKWRDEHWGKAPRAPRTPSGSQIRPVQG